MARLPRSIRRRVAVAVFAVAGAVVSLAGAACVLVDPPPDLPAETQLHPVIVKASVFPPTTEVVVELPPTGFEVPVQLFDGDTPFQYEVFVDFDPLAPHPPVIAATMSPPFALDGGVNIVDFDLTPYVAAVDPTACHPIDFVVALGFDPEAPHTPDARGGDAVTWFYDASGSLAGCADAGASSPDATAPSDADAVGDADGSTPRDM